MNLRSTINKLQKALLQTGYVVKINTRQFYSAEKNRMITMYEVLHPVDTIGKGGEPCKKDTEVIEPTASQAEVIKTLSTIYTDIVEVGDNNRT